LISNELILPLSLSIIRARCADHFGKKKFEIYSINDSAIVKILKTISYRAAVVGTTEILEYFDPRLSKF
jgi:hypothetical protein